jgi:hypothetical protein
LKIAGAGALAGVLAVLAVTAVFAQVPPPNLAPAIGVAAPFGNILGRVAKILGIEQSRLEAAIKQAHLEQIDEDEKAGRISAEHARKMREAVNSGKFGLPLASVDTIQFRIGPPFAAAAKLLGLTEEQLHQELKAGKTLAELAAARNVSRETLVQAIVEEEIKQLDQAVAAGKMPRELAERLKANARERANAIVDAKPGQPVEFEAGGGSVKFRIAFGGPH